MCVRSDVLAHQAKNCLIISDKNILLFTHKQEKGLINTNTHMLTNQEGALGVEGVGSTHINVPFVQKLKQTDVVVAVNLKRETSTQKQRKTVGVFTFRFNS